MAETTMSGGARMGIQSLSAVERSAAITALSKLTSSSSTKGLASVFGGSLKSATLKGGTVHGDAIKARGASLVTGKGSDTFAGGVKSAVKPAIHTIGSDTIVAGSAFHKAELSSKPGRALSSDTINVAGKTAAGVKASVEDKSVGHTITMADKTSITLIGVTPHNIKPH
jgi:hypothetical protein